MFQAVVLILLFASASPSPSPAPGASPASALQTIATVKAMTPECSAILTHANNAIGDELTDDATLLAAIRSLRNTHLSDPLDHNLLAREDTLHALLKLATTLNDNGFEGIAEVKHLRAVAAQTKNPQRKAELTAFADALAGALWRQRTIARDINGFVLAMDTQDLRSGDGSQADDAAGLSHVDTQGAVTRPTPDPPLDNVTDDDQAKTAAADFESRVPLILADEQTAGRHIPGAIAGC